MRKLFFSLLFLLAAPAWGGFTGLTGGDTVYVRGYRGVTDCGTPYQQWNGDTTDIDEEHVPNDAADDDLENPTNNYAELWCWNFTASDTVGWVLDSIGHGVRGKTSATSAVDVIHGLWACADPEVDVWGIVGSENTIAFPPTIYATLFHVWTEANTGVPWQWSYLTDQDHFLWGITAPSIPTLKKVYCSWAFLVIYAHATAAPSGQVIIIGAKNEAFHNPRLSRGVPDSRW